MLEESRDVLGGCSGAQDETLENFRHRIFRKNSMFDIYANARDDAWRFTLGQSGTRKLLTIGLNPSTATKEKSDPTATRVRKVAQDNGFDGFIMLNLYPIRATDFRTLPREVDEKALAQNIRTIEALVGAEKDPIIWAAWGENIAYHSFFERALRELYSRLQPRNVNWVHFGTITASGHPRHPSRLAYAWSFSPLDIESYVASLNSSAQARHGRLNVPSALLKEPILSAD
ncbi:DUF1643 domain-containing protein [Allohahella sp. A8]|uniref:DUF1643 domain-containing protein n=1 Tax=Allohahella sp. A8 TaxID=3141461 RepID=UPI003A808FC2